MDNITIISSTRRGHCWANLGQHKGKIAVGLLVAAAMVALGVAFGLNSTRPAIVHFFTKMVPQAYLHGKIAPLVTAALGGVVIGASTVSAIAACRSRRPAAKVHLFEQNGKPFKFLGSYPPII